jgi:hypothetical protein
MFRATVALEMWDCPCGRRVPGHVETCRCGRPRTSNPAPRAPVPERPVDPPASLYQSTGLRAVAAFAAMVAVYVGSRACNREVASRDARRQAEEVLARSLGPEASKTAMDRYHRACFAETYHTGWGRRQASKFDAEKYVSCLVDRVKKDRGLASPVQPEMPLAAAEPTATPSSYDSSGPLRVSEPRLLKLERPSNTYWIVLRVAGGPLPRYARVLQREHCDGSASGARFYSAQELELGFEGEMSKASAIGYARCAPHCRSCAVELAIGEHSGVPTSNTVVVKLF